MTPGGEECPGTAALWVEYYRQIRHDGTFDTLFPEVARLRGVQQPRQYHQEGDAYVHTLLAVDKVSPGADARVFWATLLHDVGKAVTTRIIDGRIRSFGHAEAGAEMVPGILARHGVANLADDVSWLVRHHTFHFSWNLTGQSRLSGRQQRFAEHVLFSLLLEVCLADAAASIGGEDKTRTILMIRDKTNMM